MAKSDAGTQSTFQPRLEALRGVAALAVAGGHSVVMFGMDPIEQKVAHLLRLVLNGHAAVSVFFALSGYVLALSLRNSPLSVRGIFAFISRRFFRIVPAMWVVLAVIVAAVWMLPGLESRPASSERWHGVWFHGLIHFSAEVATVVENATLQSFSLNTVMWTLRVELICSAFLPLLHWMSLKTSARTQAGLFCALSALPVFGLFPGTIQPLFIFYLGYQLSNSSRWTEIARRLSGKRWAVWVAFLVPAQAAGYANMPSVVVGAMNWIEGCASAFIVLSVIHGCGGVLGRVLDSRFCAGVGRLSYGFYLLHFPILFFALESLWRVLPARLPSGFAIIGGLVVFAATSAIAIAFAAALYRWVEVPGIRLGRRVSAAILGKTRSPPRAA